MLRLVSATTGFPGITNAGPEQPQIEAGVWHQVVVRKFSGNNAELWLGSEDLPLEMLGSVAVNPGGLQWFRLGINRNSDSLYVMEMANVKIYDDIDVSLTELNAEGPLLTISSEGAAVFPGEIDADRDYLEVERGLGAPAFTVSFWFRTDTVNQGGFQGLFSNNIINEPNNFSWQIDVNNGVLRFISATTGFPGITNAEAGEPQIQAGVWHHVVAWKTGGSSADFWLGSETIPLQSLGTAELNPGGLQWFRLGINRNSDSLYAMEMANVKIYDDADVSLIDLNNEGPQLIPEPGSTLLALVALPFFLRRRR